MPVLRIKLPDHKGEISHVLAGERITIGRRPENTIQIVDRSVSAHHAELISTNGHYRLHDLGSTNLTCVDGQPVTDYHLHQPCKVSFGSVQCEFTPDTPVNTGDKSEVVPTRAELEYLRRENQDLEAKMAAMQKQIDILSSARLMTKDTQQLGVMPDVHRRVQAERDEARNQVANLQLELENLRADVAGLIKERDALRLAWETAKQERDEAIARAPLSTPPISAPSVPVVPRVPQPPPIYNPAKTASEASPAKPASRTPLPEAKSKTALNATGIASVAAPFTAAPRKEEATVARTATPAVAPSLSEASVSQVTSRLDETVRISTDTTRQAVDHRAMASVLTKAPAVLKAMRASLEALQQGDNQDEASQNISNLSGALADALAPANGHTAQRLAAACAALVKDARTRPQTFEPGVTRTLLQAAEMIGALLDPRLFRKAAEAPAARALVIDDDPDLLETVTDALKTADIRATRCCTSKQGIEMLEREGFDLVLLDVGLPGENGVELCSRIRELPAHKTTPVVFLTVDATVETRAQSSLNGGDDFMPKPFNVQELAVKAATWAARQQFGVRN
jgi:CheY-like chemotaxis protein